MANTKEYRIIINGVEQSIDAVKALNAQLEALESRIKSLEGKAVGIKTSGGGSKTSSTSSLSEEEKLERQIAQLDEKRVAYSQELYQNYLAAKDVLKETVNDQKQLAAVERLQADAYSNTMNGIKQKLADLKSVHFTTDISTDEFKNQTTEINALNEKLKQLEAEYGVYSRNVGNYANGVAEGLQKIGIEVGGTVREFDNAKQALKELKKERDTLSVKKDMGLISEEEAKRLEELIPTVAGLQSSIQDAGKPMDALMDTMQSFVALTQAGKGLAAFFGFDDDEIDKSIQKLVGLQNAMQGLQTIQKQLQSNEGIASWLTKGNDAIDKLVNSIFGVEKASKAATVASKALGTALKAIGIGALVAGITALITLLETWTDKQNKAAEAAEEAAEKVRKSIEQQRQTFVNASAQYENTASRLSHLRSEYLTTNDALKKTSILKEATKEFKNLGMSVNSVTDAQNILVKQGDKVIEMIRLQGDAAALAALRMEAFKKSFSQILENNNDVNYARILASNGGLVKALDEELDKVNQKISKFQEELGIKTKESGSKQGKTIKEVEKELTRLRIEQMKEGLNKTIKQLEEERKQKILKIRADGIMVGELELEINKLYDRKIEDEKERHAEEVKRIYEKMWNDVYNISLDNYRKEKELAENSSKQYEEKLEQGKNKLYNQGISSYGVQGKKQLSQSTRDSLGIVSQNTDEYVKDYKKLIDIMREYSTAENAYKTLTVKRNAEIEEAQKRLVEIEKETNEKLKQLELDRAFMNDDEAEQKKYEIEKVLDVERLKVQKLRETSEQEIAIVIDTLNAKKALYDKYDSELKQKYDTEEKQALANATFNLLIEENYTKDMPTMFKQRMTAVEAYWATRIANEKISAEALYKQTKELEKKEYDARRRNAISQAESLNKEAFNQVKAGKLTQKEYEDYVARLQTETQNKLILLEQEYAQKMVDLENEKNEKLKKSNTEYLQDTLQEFRDFNTALSQLEQKQPVMNVWGLKNIKETNKNNKELLSSYEELARQLSQKRQQITDAFQNGIIDEPIYKQSIRELDGFSVNLGEKMDEVKKKLSFGEQWKDWAENINNVLQTVGQAATSILSSLSEIQSNEYDKMIDKQQEYIDKYSELLDKQRDKTQEYADAVKGIEDELSTARGDRRQQLIDQLNAEMAAQRASLAEQKRIEKEEEKAKEKKKKLEHDQAVAKKKMDLAQAAINAAMAISMAAVNSWPIPAIPMMAMAAAVGAAQIAAIRSQNIPSYGSGGVIQGKSHREGGVKVLGGQAEVEGGEFITNKVTTSKNVELLEYINSKKKRINLDDLIDFYGTPVRRNVQAVRTKFADGGIIPTLRNDITINDRLMTAFEDYSNRDVVVSVVDINDRQAAVNNVKVLAGLDA